MLHHACQVKAESEAGISHTRAILRCYQCNDWLHQAKKLEATGNEDNSDTSKSSDDNKNDKNHNNASNNDDEGESEGDGKQEGDTCNDDDGDNDGSSSDDESSDDDSNTSDNESSRDTTDDASSILPAPSGLKTTKPPKSTPGQPKSPIKPRRLPGSDPIAEAKLKIIVKNRTIQRKKFLQAREKLARLLDNSNTSSDGSSSDENDIYSENVNSECPGTTNPRNQLTLKDHWSPGGTRTQHRTNQESQSTHQKDQQTKTTVNRKTKHSYNITIRKK